MIEVTRGCDGCHLQCFETRKSLKWMGGWLLELLNQPQREDHKARSKTHPVCPKTEGQEWDIAPLLFFQSLSPVQARGESLAFEIFHHQVIGAVLISNVAESAVGSRQWSVGSGQWADVGWLRDEIGQASRSKRCFSSAFCEK